MKTEKQKGLICSIYADKHGSDCSLNGISSKHKEVLLVMDDERSQIFEEREEIPTVRLVKRELGGREYLHIEPEEKKRYMFGGCFIYSCDSRFPSKYPIPLHDRHEPNGCQCNCTVCEGEGHCGGLICIGD